MSGIQPATAQPYAWRDGARSGGVELLAARATGSLPSIDSAFVRGALRDAIARTITPLGVTVDVGGGSATPRAGTPTNAPSLRAPSIADMRRLVAMIPNETDYDGLIAFLCAISGAVGVERYAAGLEIAQEWGSRWRDGDSDPRFIQQKYESCNNPGVGWDRLKAHARAAGADTTEWDFTVEASAAPSRAQPRLTDGGNADRFAQVYKDRLMYAEDTWFRWDGQRWATCKDVDLVEHARQIIRAMYDELAATTDADQKKRLFNWAQRSDNVQRLRAMADLARHPLRVADECLDAQPWLLTVANSAVGLRTGQLRDT